MRLSPACHIEGSVVPLILRTLRIFGAIITVLSLIPGSTTLAAEPYLSPRNTEVPFPYLQAKTRTWSITTRPLPRDTKIQLNALHDGAVLETGERLLLTSLRVLVNKDGELEVSANAEAPAQVLQLRISLELPSGETESQTVTLQPGPPSRPLSYIADFGDDIIRMFFNGSDGSWRPVTKDAFDQYFRRCQVQGIDRLILWLSPMPSAPSAW